MAISEDMNLTPAEWTHERLPEMLWAALIVTALGIEDACRYFRLLLQFVAEHPRTEDLKDLTLSGIAGMEESLRSEFLQHMVGYPEVREALCDLLRYENLPARAEWEIYLEPPGQDLHLLMSAVGSTLWHQSDEATCCRWVRVMGWIVTGSIRFTEQTKETAERIMAYPEGDLQKTQPSVM